MSSRAAAVGETFACLSLAYGTNSHNHSQLARPRKYFHRRTILSPSWLNSRSRIFQSLLRRNPFILTLRDTDCRLTTLTCRHLPPSPRRRLLHRKNGNSHYTPIHRTAGYGLHLACLLVLPRWSWRADATL